MIKKLLLFVITGAILIVLIVIAVDARRISGITLNKINNNDEWQVILNENKFILKYVSYSSIAPKFGLARFEFDVGYALVRDDLPRKVKKFVSYHEIYHLYDFMNNLHQSVFAKEVHASLAAFPYEPLGGLQTVFLTITNLERIKYYLMLLRI